MKPIIEVKNLFKKLGEKEILHNISFSINEGEIVGLLGPNGSGKTTMIRLLNGVIDSSGGDIKVLDLDPKHEGETVRRQSGIVTESTNLYHEMSAWENLMFFSNIYGVDDKQRAEELLKDFGMWEHKDELVGSFSTGMKKRVALAKALLQRPKILFLDEPTNGLDPEGIQLVLKYLKEINKKEKITIIICSHVLHQLDGVCDSYLFLKHGKLIEGGKREEIEKRHLREVRVLVETGLGVGGEFKGFYCKKIGNDLYEFTLSSKDEISSLLKELLSVTWVHRCEITNRSLDTLYFLVGGEKNE